MASMFSGFGGYDTVMKWGTYIGYGFLMLLGCLIFVALIIFILVKMKEKIIIEINSETKKVRQMSGKEQRGQSGKVQLYISKIKKHIPQLQQKDFFLKGKRDMVFLFKDNNGLHHTMRVPNEDEIMKWYKVVHDVDLNTSDLKSNREKVQEEIDSIQKKIIELQNSDSVEETLLYKLKKKFEKKTELLKIMGNIYFLPNPAEDLNWLSHQFKESDKQFPEVWFKNPMVIMMGTFVLCTFIFIITMIVSKKM